MLKLAFRKKDGLTDDELIAGCLAERRAAQNELFSRFAPRMLGVCYRYAQTLPEAEDIMQDGFIKVFNNLHRFRRDASLETWITRIMVNTAINYLKANKKFRMETDVDLHGDNAEGAVFITDRFDTHALMEMIRQLPHGYRIVLNMFAVEGYSHKEIADVLGINESTSRSQLTRARQQLEKSIQELNDIEKKYVQYR